MSWDIDPSSKKELFNCDECGCQTIEPYYCPCSTYCGACKDELIKCRNIECGKEIKELEEDS